MLPRRSVLLGGAVLLTSGSEAGAEASAPGQSSRIPARRRRGFGWQRDLPDPGSRLLGALPFAIVPTRPARVDLSDRLPPAYDQGDLNSCTANAIAGAVQFARRAHNKPVDFTPSRLFIYYQERLTEQSLHTDVGARLKDGIASVAQLGVCPENDWPYDGIAGDPKTGVFPPNAGAIRAPTPALMTKAKQYAAISYRQLAPLTLETLESCLASGYPFAFGFTVYTNLTEATTHLTTPGPNDSITPDGHAVLAVGYDRGRREFKIRNSWGSTANNLGHFDMDYEYVLDPNMCADFWVIFETLGFV